ncbi:MAG: phosphate--acyl-ACP acyltransferase, partial [Phycisphaerae bacterium]|nr:phosphate--acyl-ACP acyltransferase [Phycisphaerae bacterium]
MRIGIDAMGGDYAPREIVRGALDALPLLNGHEIVMIGDQGAIEAEVARCGEPAKGIYSIVHASEVIDMNEAPVEAVRTKKDSSIVKMATMASRGELDAIISAGNTGAFAAASQLRMGLVPGVVRSGIAVVLPSFTGPIVMCDVGANLTPKPHHLLQYGIMASAYARNVLGIKKPRVGLLSVGQEDLKGTTLVKSALELMRPCPLINFVG